MKKRRKIKKSKKLRLKAKYRKTLSLLSILTFIIIAFIMIIPKNNYKFITKEELLSLPPSTLDPSLLTYGDNGIISYPQAQLGIDLSMHQSTVDFSLLKQQGIEFVFLRLGYRGYQSGELHLDKTFEKYYAEAKKYDLDVGVYFFSQAIDEKEAIEEANFVIKHLKNKTLDLPIAYDLEKIDYDENYRTKDLSIETKTQNALAFCGRLLYKDYQPMIYLNQDIANTFYDLEKIYNYDIWYAQYRSAPTYPYHYKYWQFSDKGKINGIKEEVDLNLRFHD
ncbi:MAG: glycoside hydrolase family 25 protein [Erysipelotrichaceae bacterium]|nr:glycoside hydrolase family 25 protein [Erysipelotrichaceae bacterium]MDY5252256.1 glycoside hydrolase family 25 protein [Erysipelotrichaceae bacterium]